MTDSAEAIRSFNHAISSLTPRFVSKSRHRKLVEQSRQIPRISDARLQESLSEQPVNWSQLRNDGSKKENTYLYLGYGSNMCALTFLDRRGIRPLSQLNVVVPEIQLTFDLAGIPFSEPCFGNTRYRDVEHDNGTIQEKDNAQAADYHKNHWHKGLVGVLYEVTASDYAHIIETEGGGASYQDVLVNCFALSADPSEPVPLHPTSMQFKGHTLYSPGRNARPDPSYAQPSARYLKLLTDGADEHDLPTEYKTFLAQIRPYKPSTIAQQLGAWLFVTIWAPIFAFLFLGTGKVFLRPDGTYPKWYAKMSLAIHIGVWTSYDGWFKPMFGDGERSIADGGSPPDSRDPSGSKSLDYDSRRNEKTPLLGLDRERQGWCEPGTRSADEMV